MRTRIFLAHPKDFVGFKENKTLVELMLTHALQRPVEVVTGNDDFNANFARSGGWDGWIASVATGAEYFNGVLVPRFNGAVIVPSAYVGKATAQIIVKMLNAKKSVYYFNGETFQRISEVLAEDPGDYQTGWHAI